jgi:hypothetical protein
VADGQGLSGAAVGRWDDAAIAAAVSKIVKKLVDDVVLSDLPVLLQQQQQQ